MHSSDQNGRALSRAIPTLAIGGRTESQAPPRIHPRNVDPFETATELGLRLALQRDHLAQRSARVLSSEHSVHVRSRREGRAPPLRLSPVALGGFESPRSGLAPSADSAGSPR